MSFSTPRCLTLALFAGILAASSAPGQVTVGLPEISGDGSLSVAGMLVDNILTPIAPSAADAQLFTGTVGLPQHLGTFDIVINAGSTLAANAAALAAFNRAAQEWEARLSDAITITIDADLGSLDPGIIGSTGSVILQADYTTIRDAVVTDAEDETDDTIVASLPTAAQFQATIPTSPARTLSGNVLVTKANAKALGFEDLDAAFGTSDAEITFSTNFSFDFDRSDGVTAGTMDFQTVAAHEIGHALGFFSIVDSVNAGATLIRPNTLDLFRFADGTANDPATAANFMTFARNLVPGVAAVNDEIHGTQPELAMSTGLANSSFPGTDGRQASHFKADELTGNFIGLMDPTLAFGQFYGPQETDFRTLDLIGYEVAPAPVPEPSVLVVLCLGGALLAGSRRARR